MARLLALLTVLVALGLFVLRPPAASAPSPAAQSSCVACHTSRTALEPLVQPFPVIPAEGEG